MFEDKLAELNSLTKYPPIETYHALDPKNGNLLEECVPFTGHAVLTEKLNGTNGRIVLLPGGDYYIGSREELWYARGDRIINPSFRLVETLKPVAERLAAERPEPVENEWVASLYFEVYGHKIGESAGQYTSGDAVGYRLFDVAFARPEVLTRSRQQISVWRESGGQRWATERVLNAISKEHGLDLTPRMDTVPGSELPTSVETTHEWLCGVMPLTRARLDEQAGGRPEGLVLRTLDRSVIAKVRFEDYEKTLRRRAEAKAVRAAKQK